MSGPNKKSLLLGLGMLGFSLLFVLYRWKDTVPVNQIAKFSMGLKLQGPPQPTPLQTMSFSYLLPESAVEDEWLSLNINKSVKDQIVVLRDALLRAHGQPMDTTRNPTCHGDRRGAEAEDLLCMPKPKYLADVRNPCWWDQTGKISCLPFFHLVGVGKCGSTDLWARITSHPDFVGIRSSNNKELRFWGKHRYALGRNTRTTFTTYTQAFGKLASTVQRSLAKGGSEHKRLITGDGTPSDLTEFRGWSLIPQNRGLKLPRVLTPHLMNHLYPNTTKFIVILRNPLERIYSSFYKVLHGKSPGQFHAWVLKAIDMLANCVRKKRRLRECFFNIEYFRRLPVRLNELDYALYIAEWLKVFPRERFLFLENKEYSQDIAGTVLKCWDFLGLKRLEDYKLKEIANTARKWVGEQKRTQGPMWLSTKKILEEVIRPSAHYLSKLLRDDRFIWDFNSVPFVEHEDK